MTLASSYVFENTKFKFKPNFSGKEGPYNAEGEMDFTIPLDEETALTMLAEGWNVKTYMAQGEDMSEVYYLQVKVSFKNYPPRIVVITAKGRTAIPEELCRMIDWIDVKYIDVVIRGSRWSVGGKSGVKAYLKTLYVIVNEDALDLKYADVPEIGLNGQYELEGSDPNVIDGDVLDEQPGRALGR